MQEDELNFEKATKLSLQFEIVEFQSRLLSSTLRNTNIKVIDSKNKNSVDVTTKSNDAQYRLGKQQIIRCKTCGYNHSLNKCK